MTGMKEGAGEDPFAEDDTSDSRPQGPDEPADTQTDVGTTDRTITGGADMGQVSIPYKYRRDGVQDGRDRVPLFLMEDTKRAEREAQRELEGRFDEDVSLTDLREAVVRAGLENLDMVEDQLEAWGYGMTFDD